MRSQNAIYGGEMSSHHYFRDFAFCDSGMIPCFLMIELVSNANKKLSTLVDSMFALFPSSGEKNFSVNNPDFIIEKVLEKFNFDADIDYTDGISFSYKDWRFNIRKSNTEPLIRLNVEAREIPDVLQWRVEQISSFIKMMDKQYEAFNNI